MTAFVIGTSVGIDANFSVFVMTIPIVNIISIIPISIAGIGLRDLVYLQVLGDSFIEDDIKLMGLLISVVVLLSTLPGAFLYFREK